MLPYGEPRKIAISRHRAAKLDPAEQLVTWAHQATIGFKHRNGGVIGRAQSTSPIDLEQDVLPIREDVAIGHDVNLGVKARPTGARDVERRAALRPIGGRPVAAHKG